MRKSKIMDSLFRGQTLLTKEPHAEVTRNDDQEYSDIVPTLSFVAKSKVCLYKDLICSAKLVNVYEVKDRGRSTAKNKMGGHIHSFSGLDFTTNKS